MDDVILSPTTCPIAIIRSYPNRVVVITPDLLFKLPEFHSYEICMRKGRGDPSKPWNSVANLSVAEPEGIVTGFEPNTNTHSEYESKRNR